MLGQTLEWVELPDDIVARLEGKSSLGRLGLLIHSTAGYVDPGWKGNLTLELSNVARLPIALYFGMRIGQISFFRMSAPVERPYGTKGLGSRYQGQRRRRRPAFYRDFESHRRRIRAARAQLACVHQGQRRLADRAGRRHVASRSSRRASSRATPARSWARCRG